MSSKRTPAYMKPPAPRDTPRKLAREPRNRREGLALLGGCLVTGVVVLGLDMNPALSTLLGVLAGAVATFAIAAAAGRG